MKNYGGKYFSILGDSISTFDGWNPPECGVYYDTEHRLDTDVIAYTDTWWGNVISELGGSLLVNHSWAGSFVIMPHNCEVESYGCSDIRTSSLDRDGKKPDVIMVYMGTNDWGAGVKLIGEKQNDLSCFTFAYESMIQKLKVNYPEAEIVCISPGRSDCSRKNDYTFDYFYGGTYIGDYVREIARVADKYGCIFVNLLSNSEGFDTVDGFHPTASGMKTIADAVLKAIEQG